MIRVSRKGEITPPPGYVALRLHLFRPAGEELRDVLTPPWPQWVKRLYELEQRQDPDMDVDAGAITPSAAVSAMSERLNNRLGLVSWTLGVLQELGWDISQDGDSLIASCETTPDAARASLERAGVAGSMCRVCDIDADGWPLLWWNSGASSGAV
jgi:hypothetical protein